MGLLGKLFGGGVVSAAEGVAGIVDKFVETDDEKKAAEIIKAKLMMKPSLAQIELNKIEAATARSSWPVDGLSFCGSVEFHWRSTLSRNLRWAPICGRVKCSPPANLWHIPWRLMGCMSWCLGCLV